jgi:hypothetical protein
LPRETWPFGGWAFGGGGGLAFGGCVDELAFASARTSGLPRRLALASARVGGTLERCFRSLIEEFLASRRTLLAKARRENASLLTSSQRALDKP